MRPVSSCTDVSVIIDGTSQSVHPFFGVLRRIAKPTHLLWLHILGHAREPCDHAIRRTLNIVFHPL